MLFTLERPVEFNHCDAAGIVFYPRYFEMISATIERFFADVLGHSFQDCLARDNTAVPLVDIQTSFKAPSRLGDLLRFELRVREVKRVSVGFSISCFCGDERRFDAKMTLVHAALEPIKTQQWPPHISQKLNDFSS